jgi:hypothetical protein
VDGIEPDHLARQAETQHLLVALAVIDKGLDHAGAHRGDRVERIAGTEQVVAGLERPTWSTSTCSSPSAVLS